ncbi:hypothetical protein ACV35P_30265, partial [Pseudomonas aeruginosa]
MLQGALAMARGTRVMLERCGAALDVQELDVEAPARLLYRYILSGHRQRAPQHQRAPGDDSSRASGAQRPDCPPARRV